ncbi:MAG: glycoside hydrolase family 44 protein [Thermoanaerobaculia bacterium]
MRLDGLMLLWLAVQTITIDTTADRHPIDERVYGVHAATAEQLRDLNVPLNRSGGNLTTRYNWEQNASNHAKDYFYESRPRGPDVPGEWLDHFLVATLNAKKTPLITIPMIEYVAKLGPGRAVLCSFPLTKFGPQQDSHENCGNGIAPGGALLTADPNDANVRVSSAFQAAWVAHMVAWWGRGGRYYMLDNEHSIWHESHRDVRPIGVTMDETLAHIIEYANAIRAADPDATILGPEEFGWTGYLYSGYDKWWAEVQGHGWSGPLPDRMAHGGMDYLPWLLRELHAHDTATGRRTLDMLTVHYYPLGKIFSDDVSEPTRLLRNRTTRSLWDPEYVDPFIGTQVRLIPRLREWVDAYYPGLPIGLTEYSWGADRDISGALAQADLLGILGREDIDLAARGETPPTGSPAYEAIKLYRNYDGRFSTFGDVSVRVSTPNPDEIAAFAAIRTHDGALTIVLINKQLVAAEVDVHVALDDQAIERYQLTREGLTRIADVATLDGIPLPPQSVTLFVAGSRGGKARAVR